MENVIDNLIMMLGRLKDFKRRGWLKRDIPHPESDGDHMFSTAFLVLFMAPRYEVDKCHCLELALTHDLQEIISGDPVPGEKTAQEKYESELKAITQLSDQLKMPVLVDWFKEFEAQETPESRFVKNLDKLDTVLTAAYYDKTRSSHVTDEFGTYALKCLENMPSVANDEVCEIIRYLNN